MKKEQILNLERIVNLFNYTKALKEGKYEAIEKMTQNKIELEIAKEFINKEVEAARKACQPKDWEKDQEKLKALLSDEKTKDTEETKLFRREMEKKLIKLREDTQKVITPILEQSMKIKIRLLTPEEKNLLLTPAYEWVQQEGKEPYEVHVNRVTTDALPLIDLLVIKNKQVKEEESDSK